MSISRKHLARKRRRSSRQRAWEDRHAAQNPAAPGAVATATRGAAVEAGQPMKKAPPKG